MFSIVCTARRAEKLTDAPTAASLHAIMVTNALHHVHRHHGHSGRGEVARVRMTA
jgi:hypothetical protein